MPTTTIPEAFRDIVSVGQVLTLATVGADGFPQVSAIWYLVEEDGTIAASLNTSRQKVKNLQANPAVTLFFIDPANSYHTLEVRAKAEITPDPDYRFADLIGARYGGADLRERDQPGDSRVAVRFVPVKINTFG